MSADETSITDIEASSNQTLVMVDGGNKKAPSMTRLFEFGAGNETRTRDPNLGKVVLYQLSYSRFSLNRIRLKWTANLRNTARGAKHRTKKLQFPVNFSMFAA